MSEQHTFLENVKVATLGDAGAITAAGNTAAIDTKGARGNALLIALGAFAVSGVNNITISLEESDTGAFAGEENAVANGGNGGVETCVMIGRTNGEDVFRGANGIPADSVLIDGTTDANGAGDKVAGDVYVLEYLGTKNYFRGVVTIGGTVNIPVQYLHGQAGLNVLPNIVDAG